MNEQEQFLLPMPLGQSTPQQSMLDENDPSRPPKTRAECPDTRIAPCPHTSCRNHLDVDDERAGKPHNNERPPTRIRDRDAERTSCEPGKIRASCSLDVVVNEVGAKVSEGLSVPTIDVAKMLGISQRRIQQLEQRAHDKEWVAHTFLEAVEQWAEVDFYKAGGELETKWGSVVTDSTLIGSKLEPYKMRVTVIAVEFDLRPEPGDRFERPFVKPRPKQKIKMPGVTKRDEPAPSGVTVRRRA